MERNWHGMMSTKYRGFDLADLAMELWRREKISTDLSDIDIEFAVRHFEKLNSNILFTIFFIK